MIFSAVLSDEDYLITRMCNCQCFLYFSYFSCNSYNFFFKSLNSTTDTTNFFEFKSAYGTGFLLPEIPDQDFSFYYISTSNSNCDKKSFCISIPGYTSISFNPFGVSRNTHLSVTYSTFCPFEIARFAEKLTLFTLFTNFGTEPSFSIVTYFLRNF